MRKILFLLLLCYWLPKFGNCQLVFHFVPEIYARNLDGLSTLQIQNTSGGFMRGQIVVVVMENSKQLLVLQLNTPSLEIKPGSTILGKTLFSNSAMKFGDNAYGKLVNQTRNFPPAEYSFCFSFVPDDKGDADYENCFDALVEPLVPMQLTLPANEDTICSKRPVLSWQPPMPFSGNMFFRLMLTEKKNAKSGLEAIRKFAPLLLLDNISSTTLVYPSNYPDLKEGSTYCWQVVAYQQNVIVSTSEVWEFTVQCKETSLANNDSYRELKLLVNGNYYITSQWLKFSFLNQYNVKRLQYAIINVQNAGKVINNVPEVRLTQGLNKVDIDISEIDLKSGQSYVLKVYPFNEPPVEVRFIYQQQ